ncbi:MAG: transposase [Chloroflexota bacterium]
MKKKKVSRYVRFAHLALKMGEATLDKYSHRNSQKRYTQPQLVAACLLGFYLNLSYRDLEEWLLASDKVCQALGLSEVPDHSTLCRAFQRLRQSDLKQLNHWLMQKLNMELTWVAVDATGYILTQASHYYLTRTGQRMKHFWQGFYAVDLDTQYIVTWCEGIGPQGADVRFLNRLRQRIHRYGQLVGRREYALLGDRGFDGDQALPTDFITPKLGRYKVIRRQDRKQRADLTNMARLDGVMGRRWLIETVISVIKRKSGASIRSRRFMRQRREIGIKAIVYNLH